MGSEKKQFPPTQRKKKQAIRAGDFANSRLFALAGKFGIFYLLFLITDFSKIITGLSFFLFKAARVQDILEIEIFTPLLCELLFLSCCFLFIFSTVPCLIALFQARFSIRLNVLKFDFSRMHPMTGLKNVFSPKRRGLGIAMRTGLLLSLWAISFLGLSVAFFYMYSRASVIFTPLSLSFIFSVFLKRALIFSFFLLFFAGIFEYLLQNIQRHRRLMMSFTELKREIRETQGDPHLINLRKELHRQINAMDYREKISRAKLLICG